MVFAASLLSSYTQLTSSSRCGAHWLGSAAARLRRLLMQLAMSVAICATVWQPACAWQDEPPAQAREPIDASVPSILKDGMLQTDIRLELRPDGGYALTNITIEELRRLERQSSSASQLPAATFIQSQVDVSVQGGLASLEGKFDVQLGSSDVPALIDLRFGSCRLTAPPQKPAGILRSSFQVNSQSGSYEWLLLGEEQSTHQLVLNGQTSIRQKADRLSLSIDLPSAITAVTVLLPHNAIEERVRSEDILERSLTEAGVLLTINSRGGDFTLSWREQGAAQRLAAMEAESNTTFEIIDPLQPWSCSTNISLRSYGNDTSSSFRIALPRGAQWRTFPNPVLDRFRITTLAASAEEGELDLSADTLPLSGTPQLLIEKIDPSAAESIELLLEWEWLPELSDNSAGAIQVQIPVPTIAGVDSHEGTLNCIFQSSFAAVFQEGAGVRLMQQGRLHLQQGFSSRYQMQFQFDRQDFELSLSLRKEESLPTIRPTYKVHVDQHKLVLTAWFECSFDTNEPRMEMGLIPGDWIVEENSARALRDATQPYALESEVLNVRREDDGSYILSGREPEAGFNNSRRVEQVWRIVAQRSWSPDDNNALEFQIPEIKRIRANGTAEVDHGSGVLLLSSENKVVTRWRETASTGLLPDSFSTEYQKFLNETRIREPLAYRFQSRGTTPTWAGVAEFLPQQIVAEQHVVLEVLPGSVRVRQDFDLRIANESLTSLRVAVRGDISSSPEVTVDGTPVSLQVVGSLTPETLLGEVPTLDAEDSRSGIESNSQSGNPTAMTGEAKRNNSPWRQYQIVGAPKLLGKSSLSIWTEVPTTLVAKTATGEAVQALEIDVPLVQVQFPSTVRFVRQDWTLINDVNFEALSAEATGSRSESQAGIKRRLLREQQLVIPLRLRQKETVAEASVLVSGCWLQSVITGNARRDRFVARVQTQAGRLNIKLPNPAQIEKVAVNGVPLEQSAAPYDYNTKTISIALPSASTPTKQTYVIELFYFMDETLSWVSALNIEPPVLEGAVNLDRFYWQLVVPAMHHLAWCPPGLTAEWTWDWNGLWWYRQSGEDQASLEQWLGSSIQTRQSLSANSYVMSGQGEFKPQVVRLLSRFALWFPMGLVAIVTSVLLLSFSWLRNSVVAIVLAGVIASLSMIWPDLGVLFGQTALLSLGLVVLIFVTQAAIEARVRRRSVFTTRPTNYIDGSEQFSVGRTSRFPASTAIRTGSSVIASEEK